MIPWRGMQPSTARDSGQVDPRRSTTDIPPPQSAALGLHPIGYYSLTDPGGMARWVGIGTQQPWAGVEPATSWSQSPASYHSATTYHVANQSLYSEWFVQLTYVKPVAYSAIKLKQNTERVLGSFQTHYHKFSKVCLNCLRLLTNKSCVSVLLGMDCAVFYVPANTV